MPLDETDIEILEQLAEDARRPYTEVGDSVGLSGPAVSERVERLREAGVIRRFTVDLDRSKLRGGVGVFVRFADADPDTLREDDAVEYVFVTAAGETACHARVAGDDAREWAADHGEVREVTLVDQASWTPTVGGATFAVACAECGNTVDEEGETTRIAGEAYHFCCPSCAARFEDRYGDLG